VTIADAPDFQDYTTWRGNTLSPSGATAFNVGFTQGLIQPVTSFASINLVCLPSSGFGTIQLQFYQDAGGTQICGDWLWPVNTVSGLQVAVPILGPYVNVIVNNQSGGNCSWLIYATPSNVGVAGITYLSTQNYISTGNVAYAIGARHNFVLPWVQGGQALFCANFSPAAGFQFEIFATQDGVTAGNVLAFLTPAGQGMVQPVVLPAIPMIISGNNISGVAATANIFLGQGQ
jgi:hypothetical protein